MKMIRAPKWSTTTLQALAKAQGKAQRDNLPLSQWTANCQRHGVSREELEASKLADKVLLPCRNDCGVHVSLPVSGQRVNMSEGKLWSDTTGEVVRCLREPAAGGATPLQARLPGACGHR